MRAFDWPCRLLAPILLGSVLLAACGSTELVPSQEPSWVRAYDNASIESIAVVDTTLQVLSSTETQGASLVRLSHDGREITRTSLSAGEYFQGAVVAEVDASVVVTGSAAIDGSRRCFVQRMEAASHKVRWSISFSGTGDQYCRDVAVFSNGDVAVIGSFTGRIKLGSETLEAAEQKHVFVTRLSGADGKVLWARRFVGNGNVQVRAIATGPDGGVVVGGQFWSTLDGGGGPMVSAGDADAFLVKLDGDGSYRWQQRFGDIGFDLVKSIAITKNGDTIAVGPLMRPADYHGKPPFFEGTMDGAMTRFDPPGNRLWQRVFTGGGSQAHHIALAPDDTIWVTGHFKGSIDLGGLAFTGRGLSDAFVASFSPEGKPLQGTQFGAAKALLYGYALFAGPRVFFGGKLDGTASFGGTSAQATEGGFVGALP